MSLLKKYFYKYTNKEKYRDYKEQIRFYNRKKRFSQQFNDRISEIQAHIRNSPTLNFKHSGHIGDVMYALPVIQELAKTHICNLYINVNQPTAGFAYRHTAGDVYINNRVYALLQPLLKKIDYISTVEKLDGQPIHVDLDLFREFPFDLNFISVRWYVHLTGTLPDFSQPSLTVNPNPMSRDKVVIARSFRARNSFVDYSFLRDYDGLLFIGLPDEYEDMKKYVPNLEYYNPADFLEMAEIIKASKFFLGNQSFCFALAECLKVPRLLEAYGDNPVVYPIGGKGYDFYFQQHFEKLFGLLYDGH